MGRNFCIPRKVNLNKSNADHFNEEDLEVAIHYKWLVYTTFDIFEDEPGILKELVELEQWLRFKLFPPRSIYPIPKTSAELREWIRTEGAPKPHKRFFNNIHLSHAFELSTQEEKDAFYNKEDLGTLTWYKWHMYAAAFPKKPDEELSSKMKKFIMMEINNYPCEECREEATEMIKEDQPQTNSRKDFSSWLNKFHQKVSASVAKRRYAPP